MRASIVSIAGPLGVIGVLLGFAGGAAAESQLATGAAGAKLTAAARVNFKIVIPPVLGLSMGAGGMATVLSNSRGATLNAGVRGAPPRGNVVFTAAARRVILQDRECTPAATHGPRTVRPNGVVDLAKSVTVCTVSMP